MYRALAHTAVPRYIPKQSVVPSDLRTDDTANSAAIGVVSDLPGDTLL
jgi:hypothetical protein